MASFSVVLFFLGIVGALLFVHPFSLLMAIWVVSTVWCVVLVVFAHDLQLGLNDLVATFATGDANHLPKMRKELVGNEDVRTCAACGKSVGTILGLVATLGIFLYDLLHFNFASPSLAAGLLIGLLLVTPTFMVFGWMIGFAVGKARHKS